MLEMTTITALIVLFIHACTWKGMIFSFVSSGLKNLPDAIKKPLFDCPICMTPWWGSFILFTGYCYDLWIIENLVQAIFILFAAAGLNTVLIYLVNQGKALAKTLNESECNCTSKEQLREERLTRMNDRFNEAFP